MPWNRANVPPSPEARLVVSHCFEESRKIQPKPSYVPKRRQMRTWSHYERLSSCIEKAKEEYARI
jgi:hypothetical protein